jgi:hypothetical protein
MRDVIFLLGMAAAGLADVLDIRTLIIAASSLLFVSAAFAFVAPGLGVSTWRAAAARLRGAEAAPALELAPVRAATLADFDLAGRLAAFGRLSPSSARRSCAQARSARSRGTRSEARHRVIRLLHPEGRRRLASLRRTATEGCDDGRRRLLRRDAA